MATEAPTELPVEETPVPTEATPLPEETATPIAEILTQVPETTEVVVFDQNGDPVPLASEEAAVRAMARPLAPRQSHSPM